MAFLKEIIQYNLMVALIRVHLYMRGLVCTKRRSSSSVRLTATNSIRFMAMTTSIYFNPKLILSGSIMQRKQINDDFLLVHPSHFPMLLHHLLSGMALTNKPTHHDHKV